MTKTKNAAEEDTKIDVQELIDDALEKIRNMTGFESIEITQSVEEGIDLHAKKTRVRLIIENLLSNAVKYHDPEKKTPYIKIIANTQDGLFVFSVEDNGLGIPKEQQHQVFSMFKRFHAKTSFGSGLGLYMIKKSADILGGSIHYEGTKDGSVFTLSIPRK